MSYRTIEFNSLVAVGDTGVSARLGSTTAAATASVIEVAACAADVRVPATTALCITTAR